MLQLQMIVQLFFEIVPKGKEGQTQYYSTDLAKVEGLGEARAKKIKNMLDSKSKHLKKSNQKTLHDTN